MNNIINKFAASVVGFLAVAGGLSGCAGADSVELTAEEQAMIDDSADFDEAAEIAEIEAALNSNTNCGLANADKTFSSIISPAFTTSNGYSAGRNGCDKAYFTRVTDYREDHTGMLNKFSYAGSIPSTKAACEDARLMVYVFDVKSDGTASFVGNVSRYGTWTPPVDGFGGYCTLPYVNIEDFCLNLDDGSFALTTGKTYQFAVSARTNNSGNPTMQPIRASSANQHESCLHQ